MLNADIQKEIDSCWQACWPTSKLNPLIMVDLITYLYYLKRLDAWQLEKEEQTSEQSIEQVFSKQQHELRWHSFTSLSADSMQKLFVKEEGVAEFISRYAQGNHVYSRLLRAPLLMTPTPKLLLNAVAIVNIMDEHDRLTQKEIYNYLLDKLATIGQQRLLALPTEISKLMVALLNPQPADIVLVPLAGTGQFLVHSAAHIQEYKNEQPNDADIEADAKSFIGLEPEPVLYRIAALNLFFSGVDNAILKELEANGKIEQSLIQKATLVFSNLLFQSIADDTTEPLTKEHLFSFIEYALEAGGRAAILLPNAQNHLHKTLIEKHTLEAVISLPKELLKGYEIKTNLLIFKKAFPERQKTIWFYEAEFSDLIKDNSPTADMSSGFHHLLNHWQHIGQHKTFEPTQKSFFVPVDQIRKYNYDLNIARYQYMVQKTRQEVRRELLGKKSGVVVILPQKTIVATAPVHNPLEKAISPTTKIDNPKSSPFTRKRMATLAAALFIAVSIGAVAFYISNTNKVTGFEASNRTLPNDTVVNAPTTTPSVNPTQNSEKRVAGQEKKRPTKKLIAKDASTQKRAQDGNKAPKKEPALASISPPVVKELEPEQTAALNNEVKGLYKILDKAYFHNDPDEATRRNAFVIHWNNSYATIKALDEKNDFVYTVFKNHLGQTSKGWLRKKDLKPVGSE